MGEIASDARRAIRERMLGNARAAERRGDTGRASELYSRYAALLRAQAEGCQGEERGRMLAAAEHYEALASGRIEATTRVVESNEGSGDGDEWICERPSVRFDDVVGLDEAKDEIRRRLIIPFERPDLREAYGVRSGGFLLLYGPPGNGKTLLARAVAGELGLPFFVAEGRNLLSKYYGESEANLGRLFDAARSHERSVVLLDELEWIASARSHNDSSEPARRLVAQLLQELNVFDEDPTSPIMLIGGTNCPWDLDAAVIRPGRLTRAVCVGLPERNARVELIRKALHGRPVAGSVDCERLAGMSDGFSAADVVGVVERCLVVAMEQAAVTNRLVKVTQDRLADEMAKWRRSTPPGLLRRYEDWSTRH